MIEFALILLAAAALLGLHAWAIRRFYVAGCEEIARQAAACEAHAVLRAEMHIAEMDRKRASQSGWDVMQCPECGCGLGPCWHFIGCSRHFQDKPPPMSEEQTRKLAEYILSDDSTPNTERQEGL